MIDAEIVKRIMELERRLNEMTAGTETAPPIIRGDGTIDPAQLADGSAANDSVYYSTTASKLVYKDGRGVVNNLY